MICSARWSLPDTLTVSIRSVRRKIAIPSRLLVAGAKRYRRRLGCHGPGKSALPRRRFNFAPDLPLLISFFRDSSQAGFPCAPWRVNVQHKREYALDRFSAI